MWDKCKNNIFMKLLIQIKAVISLQLFCKHLEPNKCLQFLYLSLKDLSNWVEGSALMVLWLVVLEKYGEKLNFMIF